MGIRQLKAKILTLLRASDFNDSVRQIADLPPRQAVNPLFSFFYHLDESVKWRAVTAMGVVTARLADSEPEGARVVMRRLMWNLNDESGGIGWGSPEAMGEIVARSERLADEYGHILISYLDPDGNYLEHPQLQYGLLWGIGRLAHARPEKAGSAVDFLLPFLSAADPYHCGLAAWAAGPLKSRSAVSGLKKLVGDGRMIRIFHDRSLNQAPVGHWAQEALAQIGELQGGHR